MGKLVIIVLGCRDLAAKDLTGKADAYVTLRIGATEQKTQLKKDTLLPRFDETFAFDNATMDGVLFIHVFDDERMMQAGDPLGVGDFSLDVLSKGQSTTVWLPLRGLSTGEVGIRLHAVDFGTDPKKGPVVRSGAITISALNAELDQDFSKELIQRLCTMLRRHDVDGNATFSFEEVTTFLTELYYTTGTTLPSDMTIYQNVKDMFHRYDKDANALLSLTEFCTLLKESKWKNTVKGKWRATGREGLGGSLWCGPGKTWAGSQLPKPGTYAGYCQADGNLVERTRPPLPLPGMIAIEGSSVGPKTVLDKKLIISCPQSIVDCEFRYCHVTGATLQRGKYVGGNLEGCQIEGMELTNVKSVRSCYLKNCVIFNVHPCDCAIEGCVMKNGTIYSTALMDCEIRDMGAFSSTFTRCRFFNFSDEGNNLIEKY